MQEQNSLEKIWEFFNVKVRKFHFLKYKIFFFECELFLKFFGLGLKRFTYLNTRRFSGFSFPEIQKCKECFSRFPFTKVDNK